MSWRYSMKVTQNGQVSIPADVRARWQSEQVSIVDMGDYIVISPVLEDPIGAARGALKGRMPPSAALRAEARAEDLVDEQRFGQQR